MWGQGTPIGLSNSNQRIIPTRVGTSKCLSLKIYLFRDHPHACGDKQVRNYERNGEKGSSPRVWGQATTNGAAEITSRIIPTRVGTSCYLNVLQRRERDHPHACGDKPSPCRSMSALHGSSPRVWGQEAQLTRIEKRLRIIPTRVGTRSYGVASNCCMRDHPHACGDKQEIPITLHTTVGSSPRVWGQVSPILTVCVLVRIIPTRVGTRYFINPCR